MQRKSFVALSFTRQKLQVVKLNSGKTHVEKFASIDLPQGLISDFEVVNPQGLSVVIKNVWRELHLNEKTVGVVVPEFSSFVKPLELPKIDIAELDEAVRWQAQEFLPSGSSEMVMDWKIVGETPEKYHILTLAMKKAILAGYVDAVSTAGLFPLLVKTPSLTLNTLSGKDPSGKLIVYSNFGETILIVAHGEKILGSSVVSPEDNADVAQRAAAIVKHYKEVDVKRVFIGGAEATQAYALAIGKALAKPVEVLKTSVHGFPPDQIQKYLVTTSLAQASSVGPSDETTINLLPSSWVKRYEGKRLKSQIWGLLFLSTLIILGCLIVTGGAYFYLGGEASKISAQIEAKNTSVPPELTSKIEEVNTTSAKVLAISEVFKTPQEVINAILSVKPDEVTIVEYKLDLDTGKINFAGIAATRESLVKFKSGLEENPDFSAISIPISSFEKDIDLEYEVSLIFVPAAKKAGSTPRIPQNVKDTNTPGF